MPTTEAAAPPPAQRLPRPGGGTIAYHKTAGRSPEVVFLTGLRSDMTGGKALALEALCRARGQAYLRFDYRGHGRSSGAFAEGTIGGWREDALDVVDRLTHGPLVLVGSSLGGWLMLLAALARPARVAGLVGIAPAADFTEELMWQRFSPDQRAVVVRDGVLQLPTPYGPEPTPITSTLIEEGRRHLLLGGPIGFAGPVRLTHGLDDPDVPWQTSLRIAERLTSTDVEVTLVKGGGHRLSEPPDLERMCGIVARLCDQFG